MTTPLGLIPGHIARTAGQLVDSTVATTREHWRRACFDATPEEAADPRPFAEVLADRSPTS